MARTYNSTDTDVCPYCKAEGCSLTCPGPDDNECFTCDGCGTEVTPTSGPDPHTGCLHGVLPAGVDQRNMLMAWLS